jgi:hypothetical protein
VIDSEKATFDSMLKACVTEKIEVSELPKMVDQSEIKIPT